MDVPSTTGIAYVEENNYFDCMERHTDETDVIHPLRCKVKYVAASSAWRFFIYVLPNFVFNDNLNSLSIQTNNYNVAIGSQNMDPSNIILKFYNWDKNLI